MNRDVDIDHLIINSFDWLELSFSRVLINVNSDLSNKCLDHFY